MSEAKNLTLDDYQAAAARTAGETETISIIKQLLRPIVPRLHATYTPMAVEAILDAAARELAPHWSHLIAAIGLAGEAGEYIERIKKHYGHSLDHPLDPEKAKKELGDVLWYVAANARREKLSLGTIGLDNNEHLAKRYKDGFTGEESINREEYKLDV